MFSTYASGLGLKRRRSKDYFDMTDNSKMSMKMAKEVEKQINYEKNSLS